MLLPFNALGVNVNDSCYTNDNPYYPTYGGQCTAFAWGRACEATGIQLQINGSPYPSAKYWYLYGPIEALGLTMGSTIQDNSIAVWSGDSSNTFGHVAYVERVEGDTVYFNEANVETYNGSTFGGGYDGYEKNRSISSFENRGTGIGPILGYIYLSETALPSIYDFWRKADPLYADPNSDIWNPNFDAQYKIVNNSNEEIYIDRLALAVHDADDNFLFDLSDPNTGQSRFYDDLALAPGESHHFVFSVGYIQESGTYKLVAKAQIDNEWHHLASQYFVMLKAPNTVISDLTSGQQVSGSVSQGDWKQYQITG
ncbi:MAG: CHAP domain-containing protein, partial [Candidatus Electrothrix sp. AR1]|nr:CHAP domain-containing protein [Candidatus Electrothrix sp. AR1]